VLQRIIFHRLRIEGEGARLCLDRSYCFNLLVLFVGALFQTELDHRLNPPCLFLQRNNRRGATGCVISWWIHDSHSSTEDVCVVRRVDVTWQCRLWWPDSSRTFHGRLKPSDRLKQGAWRMCGRPAGVHVMDVRTRYRSAADCIDLFRADDRPTTQQDECMSPNGTPSILYGMYPNLARLLRRTCSVFASTFGYCKQNLIVCATPNWLRFSYEATFIRQLSSVMLQP